MKRIALAAVLVMLCVTGSYGTTSPKPEIPANAKVTNIKLLSCVDPFVPDMYMAFYDLNDDGKPEFYTMGRFDMDKASDLEKMVEPRLYLFFDGPDATLGSIFMKVIPSGPFVRMTFDQLAQQYPYPCSMAPVFAKVTT